MGDVTNQNLVFTGLGTLSWTCGQAGYYSVVSKSSLPTPTDAGVLSGLVTTIKKNSSTVLASNAGDMGCETHGISLAVGDAINIVYTSAQAADAYPFINKIKSQVSIYQGQ